ncbi:DUF4870 domain-containing protein [Micropruina sp.]|uniref:DUF4870 domain-containing protein n=1 Tax=Micropruina sp. TaxID=2737536 RepID=UPI0039E70A92
MTNDFFAPVVSVTKSDRDRAEQRLREAHQLGRINATEFDVRMARVITAERQSDLAAAVDGPLPSSTSFPSYGGSIPPAKPTFAGSVLPSRRPLAGNGTTMAVIAHLAPFLTWLIGPAVIWAISAKGSYQRREAAKAFNWQVLAAIGGMLVSVIGWIIPGQGNPITGIWTAGWVILTVFGAVMAGKGADWTNPIRRLVPLEVLSERRA